MLPAVDHSASPAGSGGEAGAVPVGAGEARSQRDTSLPPVDNGDSAEDDQLGPTHVNTTKASHLVKVHKDKLTVSYAGKANHNQDVGAVLSNRPFAKKVLIGYFEMTVISAGCKGCIAIGLGNADFNIQRHPGWEHGSYGYHGNDGRKFQESDRRAEAYGPKFSTNDTVGCGLHFGTREIFFTKNGKHLGVAFTSPLHSYYPCVGLHSEGESVMLNFGDQPFKFRLNDMIREEREKLQSAISRIPMDATLINGVVREYLRHYACTKALEAFPAMGDASSNQQASSASLQVRREMRELIVLGDIAGAIALVDTRFPGFTASSPRAMAYLRCQEFIEHVRGGRKNEALLAAQQHIAPFLHAEAEREQKQDGAHAAGVAEGAEGNGTSPANDVSSRAQLDDDGRAMVQNVIGLLAYADPRESPLAVVYDESHRMVVADVVNSAIVRYEGGEEMSSLEKLLRHLLVSHDTLRQLQGGRGEVLELQEIIHRS